MKKKMSQLFFVSFTLLFILSACGKNKKEEAFNNYESAWEEQNYEEMYSLLSLESKDKISEADFVNRYELIYDAIGAENIELEKNDEEKENDNQDQIEFSLSMDTIVSTIELEDYQMQLVEEEQADEKSYFVKWDESLIFPQMQEGDELRVETLPAERGEIFDKDGKGLAINGPRYKIGIHPEKFSKEKVNDLARILDIDEEIIQEKLEENTNPEQFLPLVTISTEDKTLLDELLAIEGILSQETNDRLYPAGEAFGALTGYINPITAEELDEAEKGEYHSTSLIGKAGLESVYEEKLAPQDGREIYISKIEEGEELERISLAKEDAQDGEDIHLTIDSDLQKRIYDEVKEDVGTASAIDPLTGELLALVSYPSYDPNLYRTYTPNRLREEWENMDVSVFKNRFNKTYSPGSAFKLVTAAIGLEEGVIDPIEKLTIEGKSWQKDNSWGEYKINRVSQKLTKLDLKDAFIYSDNIYFAQQALKIGSETFIQGAKEFGFAENFPFEYPFVNSQIANDNEIDGEILLADSAYGQGEILMSSLHLASIYSSLVNDAKMMKPTIEQKEAEIWKENLYSEENRKTLLDSLVAVMEDPNGTGNIAQVEGIKLAGKTGTAEFKKSQKEEGKENGWFVAMDVEEPEIVLSMMIENVEDKAGSKYPAEKTRNILADYFNK